jgi:hypothetical protein
MTSFPRDFKGIWIPKEIWLDRSLTYFEKLLLAEIHSLNNPLENFDELAKYLSEFFERNEKDIMSCLHKLQRKGYISFAKGGE